LEKPAAAAVAELEHILVNHNLYFVFDTVHLFTHTCTKCVNQDLEIYTRKTKSLTDCACNGPVDLLDTMDPQNSLSCEDGQQ
jgi:hypothetical protein